MEIPCTHKILAYFVLAVRARVWVEVGATFVVISISNASPTCIVSQSNDIMDTTVLYCKFINAQRAADSEWPIYLSHLPHRLGVLVLVIYPAVPSYAAFEVRHCLIRAHGSLASALQQ